MSKRRTRSFGYAGAVVVFFVLAIGVVFFQSKTKTSPHVAATSWVSNVGAGQIAPACGSSSVGTSCNGSGATATISWSADPSIGCTDGNVVLVLNGSPVGSTFPCNGSYTWSGGSMGGTYSYSADAVLTGSCSKYGCSTYTHTLSGGTFTLPNCTPSVSCSVSPSSGYQGDPFTWTASASGGNGSYSYSWSGTDGLSGSGSQVTKSYTTTGNKTGSVTVTSLGQSSSASCTSGLGDYAAVNQCSTSLSANPSTIDEGQSSTLSWTPSSSHCGFTSCTFLDGPSGGASGTRSVTPPSSSSYGIACTGPYGTTNPAYASVTVLVPTASISANPQRVVTGGTLTVTWDATNVNSCTVSRNGVTWKNLTADGSRTVSGSDTDSITTQTTYEIQCANNGSAAAATATSVVNVTPGFQEF